MPVLSEERLLRQYLYFGTSKASKLAQALQGVKLRRKLGSEERHLRQYLYFCTSKARTFVPQQMLVQPPNI